MTRTLDLGCGQVKILGAFGVDARPFGSVDLVHDLNKHPWPIEDNSFDAVNATHIIEHVDDVPGFFSEVHRVCRDGAEVTVETPHFSNRCAYADPTHKHAFSRRFIEFFAQSKAWTPSGSFAVARSFLLEHHHDIEPFIKGDGFSIKFAHLSFSRLFRLCGIENFANWKIDFYEFYLAGIFPARDILIKLKVNKGDGVGD